MSNEPYTDLTKRSRTKILGALTTSSTSFSKAVESILSDAVSWGRREAEISQRKEFHASVDANNYHELRDDVAEQAIDDLFEGVKLKTVIERVCLAGAAFGFQSFHRDNSDESLDAAIERITAAAKAREPDAKVFTLTADEANELIEPLIDMKPEKAIRYARSIFTGFKINSNEVPAFKTFLDKYAAMIMPV